MMSPACSRLMVVGGWGVRAEMLESLYRHWPGEVITVSLDDDLMGRCDTVRDLALELLDLYPEPANWLGWSLGAQVVMEAAGVGAGSVASVITLAGFPRFVAGEGWLTGMPAHEFRAFSRGFARDQERYWLHFQLLMINGSRDEARERAAIKPWLEQGCGVSAENLGKGLQWLGENDQRELWTTLAVPALHLLGERDRVVVSWQSRLSCPDPSLVRVIGDMGHWPGPSTVPTCFEEIQSFTCNLRSPALWV